MDIEELKASTALAENKFQEEKEKNRDQLTKRLLKLLPKGRIDVKYQISHWRGPKTVTGTVVEAFVNMDCVKFTVATDSGIRVRIHPSEVISIEQAKQ